MASNLSDTSSNSALATNAIISANSLFKLAMRCVGDCIMASEDQSATYLFNPLLNLTVTILSLLLNISNHETNDNLRSAAVKFTETVILRFSKKDQSGRKTGNANDEDFNLEDVPDGHPTITRSSLENIGTWCFNCLRGWCRTGGQVRNRLPDVAPSPSPPPIFRNVSDPPSPCRTSFFPDGDY